MKTMREQILSEIDAHCAETGMSVTAFGVAVRNDPALVHHLRNDTRSITIDTVDKIRAYIRGELPPRGTDENGTPPPIKAMAAS